MSSLQSALLAVSAVRAVRARKLRSKKTVNHFNTNTTQHAEQIRSTAASELQKLARKIASELRDDNFDSVRQKHQVQVGSVIAAAIREAYNTGHAFIEQFAGRTILFSERQLQQMNAEIDDAISRFWNNLQKAHLEQQSKILGAAGESGILSTFLNFVSHLSTSITYQGINTGTISTYQQHYQDQIHTVPIRGDNALFLDYPTRPGTIPPLPTSQPVPPLLMWVSERDGRVCPICLNYDGRTYDANDPHMDIPGPPEHGGTSHWGCRCRMLPEIDGKVFNA